MISGDLHHDTGFIFNANSAIFNDFQNKLHFPIQHCYYWHDGAGSQFKNTHNLGNLVHKKDDFILHQIGLFLKQHLGKDQLMALVQQFE